MTLKDASKWLRHPAVLLTPECAEITAPLAELETAVETTESDFGEDFFGEHSSSDSADDGIAESDAPRNPLE